MEGELTLFAQGCNLWKTMPDFDRRVQKSAPTNRKIRRRIGPELISA
jgi:hypothetical protein